MDLTGFSLILFHKTGEERIEALDAALDGEAGTAIRNLRGFHGLLRCDFADLQLKPDDPHPYDRLLLISFDQNATEQRISDLSGWAQDLQSKGLIGDYSAHVFEWIRPLAQSEQGDVGRVTHLNVVINSAKPGQDEPYNAWYDNHHVPELLAAPGPVAFRRGALSAHQLSPTNDQPGKYTVLMASSTDSLGEMLGELGARTMGKSASGVQFTPRSAALSDVSTIDVFRVRRSLEGGL